MTTINEDDVEQLALRWLADLDWQTVNGLDIAPDSVGGEREDFEVVVLERRLRDAIERLNPDGGFEALDVCIANPVKIE